MEIKEESLKTIKTSEEAIAIFFSLSLYGYKLL